MQSKVYHGESDGVGRKSTFRNNFMANSVKPPTHEAVLSKERESNDWILVSGAQNYKKSQEERMGCITMLVFQLQILNTCTCVDLSILCTCVEFYIVSQGGRMVKTLNA